MNPERWQKLDELFHSALEREPHDRAAFVAEATSGDDALRHELESMLAHNQQANSFIEFPAYALAAETILDDEPSESLIGRKFGSYQVLSLLGQSGMGQVYLALDADLQRKVALKFLRSDLAGDNSRMQRLRQEARAASALNHPNIITVHQIGEVEGMQFIATEFVEGETLRQIIRRKRLSIAEALEISTQIASALSVAHAVGILHRDIKPENIMVRPDGYVKVLDFGLAKLVQPPVANSDAWTLVNTAEGTIVGTIQYMSPEQARGLAVDARTDIWSLGVVLYEMLSGRPPFEGETKSDVIAAILEREPPPLLPDAEDAPEALRRIVSKALTKSRNERYQNAEELLQDVRRLKQRLEVAASEPTDLSLKSKWQISTGDEAANQTRLIAEARRTSSAEYIVREIKQHKTSVALVLAILAIAVTGVSFWVYRFVERNRAAAHFQAPKVTKLTARGRAFSAAISRDGKYISYVAREGGQLSLWLRQVATTTDVQLLSPAQIGIRGLTFSHDNDYIFYISDSALYRVSLLGGIAKKLMTGLNGSITLSPDDKKLAFVRSSVEQEESTLVIANVDGSEERTLATRKAPEDLEVPAWSPDGKVIACSVGNSAGGISWYVAEVQVESGAVRQMSAKRWFFGRSLAWLPDGGGLLLTAQDAAALPPQIWHLSYPAGEVRRITNDFKLYSSLSLSADTLVATTSEFHSSIWIVPDGDSSKRQQITSGASTDEGRIGIAWTPQGGMAYASNESGNWDIWIMNPDGTNRRQLTANAGVNLSPSVSPDGRFIVYDSSNDVWRIDSDGSNPKQLTNTGNISHPVFSPDGKWVIYGAHSTAGAAGRWTVWKVSIEGGNAMQLIDKNSFGPEISPDGKLIACFLIDEPESPHVKIAVFPFEGGQPIKLFDIPPTAGNAIATQLHWTPDGQSIAYIGRLPGQGDSNIWGQPLAGGPPKQLTDLKSVFIWNFDWSRDGKQLALAQGATTSDVVLISNFK